jgi:galactose-1-phosphate uridylyltransferase
VQSIEYRVDPLTELPCRINCERAFRVKQAEEGKGEEFKSFGAFIEKGEKDCSFCPENMEKETPRFPPNICQEGRIKKGESYLFPNLFPFGEYHAVGIITSRHYLDLDEFTSEMLQDNMKACQEWILKVYEQDKEAKYPIYNWNHLPPSAASIVHPHVQVLIDKKPTPYLEQLLKKSEEYHLKTGRNFWEELVWEEKRLKERYIGENDSLSIITSFAPQGNREIVLIFKGASSILDLDEEKIRDFAVSLVKILRGYKAMDVGSFNLTTFSGPIGEKLDYYSLNAKIISRPFPHPFYTNDTGFMERFHCENIIETLPEDITSKFKALF